ncbi:MAG: toxin-antitoxin system HicB family antitoxin [Spirochaetia bacterium]|nr:toxin-antitoxin system HicB family antitoxin [Spirochaetia bacterium]
MAKKNFKRDNPAMDFITQHTEYTQGTHTEQAQPTQYEYTAQAETKSKRLNLLIQPSLHENLVRISKINQVSLNELINQVLKDHEQKNQAAIAKYKKIWE